MDHGDGELATRVPVSPRGIATDTAGNLYLADFLFHQVRRVDRTTGVITTVAGNGSNITNGDGGPALAAGLEPEYLAIDAAGNLYIGDRRNYVVRRVDAGTGIITTVTRGFWLLKGIALDAAGNLYVGDGLAMYPEPPPDERVQVVYRVDVATGSRTVVTGAGAGVWSIALDSAGGIYESDTILPPEWIGYGDPYGNVITRFDQVTGVKSRVVGNGQFGFGGDGGPATSAMVRFPEGMAIDPSGNLFFADNGNHRIRWVEAATGTINTLAGDGIPRFRGENVPAISAQLAYPLSLAFDPDGDLLFSDSGNNRVRILTTHCEKLAPTLVLSASPTALWPPNHRLVDVSISAEPVCGSAIVTLESVTSSEPDDMPGGADGTTDDDIQGVTPGTADFTFSLRAERSGSGQGRAYRAAYRAIDTFGRSATSTVVISVPHNRGGVTDPIEITLSDSSAGTALTWRPVAGAFGYNVVRGDLRRLHESSGGIHLGGLACIEAGSTNADTLGWEDPEIPYPGLVFFYLVDYEDASGRSAYGETDAALPRDQWSGGCR